MNKLFLKIYDFLSKRKALTVIILVALMGICALLAFRLDYDEDISAFLPQSEQSRKYSAVYKQLGGSAKVAVFFRLKDSDDGDKKVDDTADGDVDGVADRKVDGIADGDVDRAADREIDGTSGEAVDKKVNGTEKIIEAMDSFGEFWADADTAGIVTDMQTSFDGSAVFEAMDFIRSHHAYYLDEKDYERIDSLLSVPDYISKTIAADRDALLFPGSSFTAANLRYDPLRLFNSNFEALKAMNVGENNNVIDGHLFTQDGSAGIVFFSSPYGESETGMNSRLVAMLEDVIRTTSGQYPDIEITSTGGPVIAVANADRIKKDSIAAVAIALALILLLLFLQFRNLRDILWIGLTILCGSLFSLAFISIFKSSISIIILGIGSVIIGIAVNYPLHYIDYLKYESDTRKALREIISPLTTGNITTVLAFLSLQLIRTSALKDFGLVGAMMLVGTILFAIIFLPALMPNHRKRSAKALKLSIDNKITDRAYTRMFIPFLIVTALLAYLGRNTQFDPDMHSINYMTESQKRNLIELSSLSGESDTLETVYAVCEASDMETLLQHNESLVNSINKLSNKALHNETLGNKQHNEALVSHISSDRIDENPESSQNAESPQNTDIPDDRSDNGANGAQQKLKISSISTVLPSKALQEKRLRMWSEFWASHSDILPKVLKEAEKAGFTANAFAPFAESVTSTHEPLDAEHFAPIADIFGNSFVIDGPDGGIAAVNFVKVPQGTAVETAGIPDSFCFRSKDVSNSLAAMLSEEFDTIGFVCGLIVFVFLWLSFGRLEISIIAFLPLAVSWLWILGLMHIFGISFNIVNVILATFIFGQGDDYTIFITEGLMHEYGTGKKILDSYRSSVAFSALIMFIGIGVLAFAGHPAMRSLGQVTVIGMFTVVLLAYYLPPLVFNFLTKKNGERRRYPITLGRLWNTILSGLFFILCIIFLIPGVKIYFAFDKSEERKLCYHRFLQRLSRFIMTHIPGTEFSWKNVADEDFSKPAVIICNHQSHFDVMMLMMLSPKIVILANEWAWNNVFYRTIIRAADFFPASNIMEDNVENLRDMVAKGYSIAVFPEGTRSVDCRILRFHPGAFALAEKLNTDILPVVIHGFGKVLPKNESLSRGGRMYAEVLPRIRVEDMGESLRDQTKAFRRFYTEQYARICREQETPEYFARYIRLAYTYKGADVEKDVRKSLKDLSWIDEIPREATEFTLNGCGAGAGALALALSRPDMEVYADGSDEDLLDVARHCQINPPNLHYPAATDGSTLNMHNTLENTAPDTATLDYASEVKE